MRGLLRVGLMHVEREFDPKAPLPTHHDTLTQDLALDAVLRAMAASDPYLLDIARVALLTGVREDVETVHHRQAVLRDTVDNAAVVRRLYAIAVDGTEAKRRGYLGIFGRYPSSILSGSVDLLRVLMQTIRTLREIIDAHCGRFTSLGFTRLFSLLQTEFSDAYLTSVDRHLHQLKFDAGVLLSARLGKGNAGTAYLLRKPRADPPNWFERLLGKGPPGYTFDIDHRDEAGARALSEIRDRGINEVANAVAQSADHIVGFFELLRAELAFYVACLNLHDKLASLGSPACFPVPSPVNMRALNFRGLYDLPLVLSMGRPAVTNSLGLDGMNLVVVTGANQGGKSTFLRAVGVATVMMQAGMFVGAEAYAGSLTSSVFTHYKREEDPTMRQGKLDEEMSRMSEIADAVGPNGLVLFNESFAATNEREGSEIAHQIVAALLERHVRMLFVTHLYTFAQVLHAEGRRDAAFLRAERLSDGTRTFRLIPGEPLETSFGADVYRAVFGTTAG